MPKPQLVQQMRKLDAPPQPPISALSHLSSMVPNAQVLSHGNRPLYQAVMLYVARPSHPERHLP
jgi:hypothetical protein